MAAPIGNKNAKGMKPNQTSFKKGHTFGILTQFKKGQVAWNKEKHPDYVQGENNPFYGKTHSLDTRKKIGKSLKGKTAWNKGKKLPQFSGANHPNWKGGVTTRDRLERTRFQKSMQKQIFERDGYTCQMCGVRGVDLQVDHIQSWKDFIELRFSMDNCRTLCAKCHYKITFGREMPLELKSWGHNLLQRGAQ